MPTRVGYDFDEDEDEDDDEDEENDDSDASAPGRRLRPSELPDAADVDPADDDTEPCPYCGRPVYAFADVCPHCHSFVSLDAVGDHKPRWLLVTGLALLALIVIGILRGIRWF